MLHFDQGGNNPDSTTFFTNLIERGVQFDVIGLSYYTFFHGPVAGLRDNVDKLAIAVRQGHRDRRRRSRRGRSPTATPRATSSGRRARSKPDTRPAAGGQLSLNNDLLSILAHAPNGQRRGFVLLVAGVGARRRLGARGRNAERQPHPLRLPGSGPSVDRDVREPHGRLPALRPLRRPVRRAGLIGWGICCSRDVRPWPREPGGDAVDVLIRDGRIATIGTG